jgi:hypothetical protein
VKQKFQSGVIFKVNNGKDTHFWQDVWAGSMPLKLVYTQLYEHCGQKQCLVGDCWEGGNGSWILEEH